MAYAQEVGERLRRVRLEVGLSLQEVERRSEGRWKAAVVGSYERGDRNISATRLLELADFYGVAPAEVLPGDPPARQSDGGGVVLDLAVLESLGERYAPLRRYLAAIQIERGDYTREVLSVRADDVRALAVIHDAPPEDLLTELRALGVLRSDAGNVT